MSDTTINKNVGSTTYLFAFTIVAFVPPTKYGG